MIPLCICSDWYQTAAFTAIMTHLYGLLELAKRQGLKKVYVHCFLDGRDTPPTSGKEFVAELEKKMTAAWHRRGGFRDGTLLCDGP